MIRDEEDAAAEGPARSSSKIYRQQDDGSAWDDEEGEGALAGALSVTVNLDIEWANPSSNRSASADSMGPISLQVADLPLQLRSAFCLSMIMGVTPGPRQPRATNLFKHLVPIVLELRAAREHGMWIRTPKYPAGEFGHPFPMASADKRYRAAIACQSGLLMRGSTRSS